MNPSDERQVVDTLGKQAELLQGLIENVGRQTKLIGELNGQIVELRKRVDNLEAGEA